MAQPGSVSRGFGGRILSVVEPTEGTTPTNPTLIKFSDHVQGVQLSIDPAHEGYRDIGDFDVASFVQGLSSYGLKVTYLLHVDRKTQLDDAVNRQSNNSLKSQSIEVSVNRDGSNPGFFTFKGCKAQEVAVRAEVGKPAVIEVTYRALSVVTASAEPSVGTGSRESAALGILSRFATSIVTRGGSALAFITRAAEFRVSHSLQVYGTDNQADPKTIIEGERSVSGRADISLDDGGVAIWADVAAGTEASVVFKLGATGAPQFTLNNTRWGKLDLNLAASEGIVMQGVPFDAKSVTTGAVA